MADIKYHDSGEPVKCVVEDCKARFHRPQDAMGALSTQDIAQLHGWLLVRFAVEGTEVEGLVCPQHSHLLKDPNPSFSIKGEAE